jgi:hypothetical protein
MSQSEVVYKPSKVITLNITDLAADTLLSDASGLSAFDLSDVNWERIIVECNITAITGTNVTFKVLTGNRNAITASSPVAKAGNGSSDFSSGTLTTAGVTMFAASKGAMDGSAVSTVGRYIGILADVTAVTDLDGTITIYVEGR